MKKKFMAGLAALCLTLAGCGTDVGNKAAEAAEAAASAKSTIQDAAETVKETVGQNAELAAIFNETALKVTSIATQFMKDAASGDLTAEDVKALYEEKKAEADRLLDEGVQKMQAVSAEAEEVQKNIEQLTSFVKENEEQMEQLIEVAEKVADAVKKN